MQDGVSEVYPLRHGNRKLGVPPSNSPASLHIGKLVRTRPRLSLNVFLSHGVCVCVFFHFAVAVQHWHQRHVRAQQLVEAQLPAA